MHALEALLGFIITILVIGAVGAAYFAPTIVSYLRKMRNIGTIAVVNVFFGWTFIGWVVAMAMACGDPTPRVYLAAPPVTVNVNKGEVEDQ